MNQLLRGKIILAFLLFCAFGLSAQSVYINEVDYSTAVPDIPVGQSIEIVADDEVDLEGWTVSTYDENGGLIETTSINLAPTSSSGTKDIIIVDVILMADPNGGISIQDAGNVVQQFLYYGEDLTDSGGFSAQDGPAVGTTPTYIGAQAIGQSLQLGGPGTEFGHTAWQSAAPTLGEVNDGVGQDLGGDFVVLPVELLLFEAQLNERNIDIRWATGSEHNSFYFVLERSLNGAPFTEINRTQAAGFSEQRLDYRHTDQSPPVGVLYYRLTEVDYDGMMSTFDVVAVTNKKDKADPVVYPNPVDQQLQIAFAEPLENVTVEIYEITSRRLCHKQEIEQPGYQLTLDCSQLEAGQYLVRLRSTRYLFEQRFVKLTR